MAQAKQKIKVLHLIDSGGLYGAEKMLLALVAEQVKQGLEPMILSAGEPSIQEKAIETEARRLGLPVRAWRMSPGLNLVETKEILNWAESEGYNLFHSHGYKFNILLALLKRSKRIHVVSTVHGLTQSPLLSKLKIFQLMDRALSVFLDGLSFVASRTRKKYWNSNSVLIGNGIDLSRFNQDSSPTTNGVILAVGRLATEKGFDLLIESFSLLKKEKENIELRICGDGPLRKELEDLSEKLGVQVDFLGFVEDISAQMKESEVLALSSTTEAMPVSIIEAMSAKLKIVSTDVGDVRSMLKGYPCSEVVVKRTVSEFSQALKRQLEKEPDFSFFDEENFEFRFGIQSMANGYLNFYKLVLAK